MTTEIIDDRELALPVGYAATDFRYEISYSEYLDLAQNWTLQAIVKDGAVIGALFENANGEVHVSILRPWRKKWLTKGLLKQIVERPNFFTRVDDGNEFMYGILARLGMTLRPDGTVGRN